MKANKLFRKLALSGVALGAAAVTLTATTFAWYTSNTEADVTQVSAATEAKGSDSLFIATANDYDTAANGYVAKSWDDYLAKATPHLSAGGSATYTLKPVYSSYDSTAGRSYKAIEEATDSGVTYAAEDNTNFLEFAFRIKTADKITTAKNLYFSEFNLVSSATTSGQSITQIALASGEGTGISTKGQQYGAGLLKALKLDITTAEVTLGTGDKLGEIPDAGATTRKAGATDEANSVTTLGFEALETVADTNISTANAVGYYKKVMGLTTFAAPQAYVAGTEVNDSGATALSIGEIPVSQQNQEFSVVEVRFVLYLDGWDNYCYDIMQGQTVTLSFQLTTDSAKAVIKTGNAPQQP